MVPQVSASRPAAPLPDVDVVVVSAVSVVPTPLVSARMFTFGGAVLMVSEHKPGLGNPLHVTRVCAKRDGSWVETLSYQTAMREKLKQVIGRSLR
jgi:hypothetical protein